MALNTKVRTSSFSLFFSVFIFCYCLASCSSSDSVNVISNPAKHIKPNVLYTIFSKPDPDLAIFCWTGEEKSFLSFWKTATFHLSIQDDDFTIYKGDNESHVSNLHKTLQESWFPFLPWKEKTISISPFNSSCTGVFTNREFSIRLDLRRLNFNRFLLSLSGLAMFLVAPSLCENIVFQYTSGTVLGVLGSVLIIIYFTSRLIPKKSGAYAVLVGGSSVVFYLLRSLWENMYSIMREYNYYVLGYLIISSIISFAICYRFGPVNNSKTVHLLQWGLQFVGLCLIFVSSEHKEASMGIVLVTIVGYNFPRSVKSHFQTIWLKKFPPSVRLLSEDEYFDQGRIETKNALEGLRQFSRSPDCNAWKTMSRLKDPMRFAEFVEGQSHLSDREVLDYETATILPDFTDDESDESE